MPLSLWTSSARFPSRNTVNVEELKNRSRLNADGLRSVGQVALTQQNVMMAKITSFSMNCDAVQVSKFVLVVFKFHKTPV